MGANLREDGEQMVPGDVIEPGDLVCLQAGPRAVEPLRRHLVDFLWRLANHE